MSLIGAEVLVPIPEVSPVPIEMRIAVPEGADAEWRIRIYAYIMAKHYARDAPTTCSWCEGELKKGRIYHYKPDGPSTYCSAGCLIASL